jgi:PAS domain S-box-containing protein
MGAPTLSSTPAAAIDAIATRERQLLDALPAMVYAVDVDGRVTNVNGAARRDAANSGIHVHDDSAVVGTPIWDALSSVAPRARIEGAMARLRGGHAPAVTWDFPVRSADEERLYVVHVAPVTERETLSGFVFTITDVTSSHRRRRLEAIGEVAAGAAHELRNPLFGISSAAQLLRFRVRDDPVIEKNVGRILREVERLNGMVASLLEYGRPAPIRLTRADPDEVWHDVIGVQRGLLESKALVIRHEPAVPRAICHVDVEQLAQAFLHLLVNAADAAAEGTDLTLVSSRLADGSWHSRLHNAGSPIPPEVLPRVFELFFSTKPGGTGIGLALCQRVFEEHEGRITIESSAEQGTTVGITLPAARSDG